MRSLIAVAVLLLSACAGNVTGPTPDLLVATPPPAGTVQPATVGQPVYYVPPTPEPAPQTAAVPSALPFEIEWMANGGVRLSLPKGSAPKTALVRWFRNADSADETEYARAAQVVVPGSPATLTPPCVYRFLNKRTVEIPGETHWPAFREFYVPTPSTCS